MTSQDTRPAAGLQATAAAPGGPTLADAVYRRLGSDIVSGRLAPGTKLAFHLLKARYGVSVSTAREALQRLAGEQMVASEGHRGFRVAGLSLAELQDLNALRIQLEPRALRESIAHGDAAWEERVMLASHRLSRVPRPANLRDEDADYWEGCHNALHEALISASPSPWLLQFCRILCDQSSRYRRFIFTTYSNEPQHKKDVEDEHQAIVAAALARDAEQAVDLLVRHYENTARRVLAKFPVPAPTAG